MIYVVPTRAAGSLVRTVIPSFVFVVAVLSILRGAYLAGLLTCVAIFAIALAGLLPHVEEIRLPSAFASASGAGGSNAIQTRKVEWTPTRTGWRVLRPSLS